MQVRNDGRSAVAAPHPGTISSHQQDLHIEARQHAFEAAREAYHRVLNEAAGNLPRSASSRPLTRLM